MSYSGLHLGHYTSMAHSDLLSEILHRLKLALIAKMGPASEQWMRRLPVILEIFSGVALVAKLHAIQLMDVDFNYHNRLIFEK